jgi:hypothetical protein
VNRKHTLSIPVKSRLLSTDAAREACLVELKRAHADRAFVFNSDARIVEEQWGPQIESLAETVRYFARRGMETVVWIGETIGHGGSVEAYKDKNEEGIKLDFQPLVALDGTPQPCRFCPFDKRFRDLIANHVAAVAKCGARTMILDDDFRINETLESAACACPLHLARIREITGMKDLTREELDRAAFTGKDNALRRAFIQANGESMREFAQAVRDAVDEVDPMIRIGSCAPHSTYGIDGATSVEISRILAGEGNRPLLRGHGAPYWHGSWMMLPSIFEIARNFGTISREEDPSIELLAECDAYPRPRYHCPASYLDLFDAAMRADGVHDGNLKYMIDYYSPPDYERGYIDMHLRDAAALDEISRVFGDGANLGVRIHSSSSCFNASDFALSPRTTDGPIPYAGFACAFAGVPTIYRGESSVHAAFGEDVRSLSESELGKPLLLDAVSALILSDMGVDCGISRDGEWRGINARFLVDGDKGIKALCSNANARVWTGMRAVGSGNNPVVMLEEDGATPLAYRYENARGQRFFVYLYDAMSLSRCSGMFRGYLAGDVLRRGIEFLAPDAFPMFTGHPDVYVSAVKADDGAVSVLVCNCSADPVLDCRPFGEGEVPAFSFRLFKIPRVHEGRWCRCSSWQSLSSG